MRSWNGTCLYVGDFLKKYASFFSAVLGSVFASLEAQRIKCLPATRETRVRSLGREDPLKKEMATHSSILALEIPCTEEPGGLQSRDHKESDTTE